jgi:hypothetical protein
MIAPAALISKQDPRVKKELNFIRKYFFQMPCYISGDQVVFATQEIKHKNILPVSWGTMETKTGEIDLKDEPLKPNGLSMICFGDKNKNDIERARELGREDLAKLVKDLVYVVPFNDTTPDKQFETSLEEFYTRP